MRGLRVARRDVGEGVVGAVTQGAALARGRLLLLLNNDTVVQPGALDTMADTLDQDAAGMCGHTAPCDASLEDVLRRHAGRFVADLADAGACALGRVGNADAVVLPIDARADAVEVIQLLAAS